MAYHVELQFAAKTDTGLVRSHNEDAIAISDACGFVILADGMGGYNAGEVASGMAISMIKDALEYRLRDLPWGQQLSINRQLQNLLTESIEQTNTSIFNASRADPRYAGMGTTLVTALFHHNKIIIAHVGDSRAYRLRAGKFEAITRDHSLLQEQIDAGLVDPEWARFSPNRNLVTRAIGVGSDVDIEVHEYMTQIGDLYLLCSDGLSDMLATQEIADIISGNNNGLEAICDALICKANENGGRDNTSVILANVKSNSAEPHGLLGRIMNWVR